MGTLTYDGMNVEFDDVTLAHLQVVIVKNFRAGRGFLMSWLDAKEIGDGRTSVWLTPTFPAHFKFQGSRTPVMNRLWLEALFTSADSGSGLVVSNEAGQLVRSLGQRIERH